MAGKPEADFIDKRNKYLATEKAKEKSPNWDKHEESLKAKTTGQQLQGWPFNEGIPKNRMSSFNIILSDGQIATATVDLTTQYCAEGIQWKTKGNTWNKQQVAAWKEI